MSNKQINSWQSKQELAEHLYGVSHTGVVPIKLSSETISKQKKSDPVKRNDNLIKAMIQWSNQQ